MNIFKDIASKLGGGSSDGALDEIQGAGDQHPDEKKLVAYIREKIDQVRQTNSRITQEGLAFTNLSYLLGYDGVYYDTNYRQFRNIDPKRRLSRNRFRINKILPTIQNRLARLTQSPPKWDVRPNSDSSTDKDCARLGSEIIEFLLDKQNFVEKRQDMLMSAMQAGIGYIQCHWDPMLGEPMFDPETKELIGYEGDIRIEPLSFFEVYSDPLAKSLEDAQWIIKAKVRKLDYFKERYPDRGMAVKEEDAWLQSSLWDLKANAITATGIAGAQTAEQTKNSAIELVYYEKRSKEYPNGRMIVAASGILLEDKELPIGEFDIIKFDDILIGGRYHSEAIITHLRPIQDQYNITRTKMAQWIRTLLAGKYMVAKGAGLSQEALNDDTEVLEFNPVPGAPPPSPMSMPQIPSFVYEDIKTLDGEFDFVSGLSDINRGESDSSSMPFRLGALLVEQNQTRISVQTSRNEVGYAKLGGCILKYVGKYYEMPRVMKIAGDGLEYAVKEFKGQDLKNNYDVIVIPGSTVPDSKVLKRQDIINAFQMGLLGDPADPKLRSKVLKMMEFGDVAEMWKEQALDDQAVKKTISAIEDGSFDVQKPGHEWDNHEVFITEMNNFRKTDKFEEMSDGQKGLFNYVIEWHIQALVALQHPEVAQQQMMAQHMANVTQKHIAENPTPPPGSPPPLPDMNQQPTDQAPGGMPAAQPMGA